MDRCKYKTYDFPYGFSCIQCEAIWYYPDTNDPLLCAKCESEVKAYQVSDRKQKYVEYLDKRVEQDLKKMNEILKEFYYGPIQEQLNQHILVQKQFVENNLYGVGETIVMNYEVKLE